MNSCSSVMIITLWNVYRGEYYLVCRASNLKIRLRCSRIVTFLRLWPSHVLYIVWFSIHLKEEKKNVIFHAYEMHLYYVEKCARFIWKIAPRRKISDTQNWYTLGRKKNSIESSSITFWVHSILNWKFGNKPKKHKNAQYDHRVYFRYIYYLCWKYFNIIRISIFLHRRWWTNNSKYFHEI